MPELFLYQNGTRGDVVLSRPLFRAVAAATPGVTIAVCRGDEELVDDLCSAGCRVVVSDYRNGPAGAPLDLEALCPAGAVPIELWLGGRDVLPNRQWTDALGALDDRLRRAGVVLALPDADGEVPMPDLGRDGEIVTPALRRPSIYLDLERTTRPAGWFVYDLPRLVRALPDLDLLCTAPPPCTADNLVDVSRLSWPERARLSECCVALVGSAPDPFALTLTEANRTRPKALCGFDPRRLRPFWDYPGNPMELLQTMDELVDFLLANAAEVVA